MTRKLILKRSVLVLGVFALALGGAKVRTCLRRAGSLPSKGNAEELFTETVQPMLDRSCVKCHGAEEHNGDLRLDSLEAALIGGRSGPALVPGHPEKSLMVQLVRHKEPKREMPPRGTVKDSKIAALESWVKAGAPWPDNPSQTSQAGGSGTVVGPAWSDPRNPIVRLFGGKRLDLWSLKPISEPPPPKVRDRAWVRNPIDAFVLARIEAAGEKPAPEADRRVLVRRLYFDLTGLPPSPGEVAEFMADTSPAAYEQLVDRLLDSPRYGEHWARLWLDVVRYSDSNGFDYDEFRPQAWRFRDYVIRSLNSGKPYDRFVREQLAGDEMLAGPPQNAEDQDCLIATGYLRVGPYDNSAVLFGEKDRCRAQVLSDLVETTGAAFLGTNMSCCRCHDHKVDPLSQTDYYRLRAVFENVQPNDDLLLDLAPQLAVINPEAAAIRRVRETLPEIEEAAAKRITNEKTSKLSPGDQQLLLRTFDDLPQNLKDKVQQIKRTIHTSNLEAKTQFNQKEKEKYAVVTAKLKDLEKKRSPFTPGFLVTDEGYWTSETHLLSKGDYTQPKEVVAPGVFSVLDPNPLTRGQTARARTSGRRTAFADWLFSKDNPLTARVMVNRLWQGHFGEGLQATPNDFGFAGARPSNPELLDWLSQEFRRGGWSLKNMHRLMVESATYRQGFTQASASNRSPFSKQVPHRLTAEELRDAMLSVSGRLLPHAGGPPLWPELPPEVLNSPNLLIENEEKTRGWYPSPRDQTFVRSIYLVQKRSLRLPMLETFDQPESSLSCGRRNVSTVAPQALTLLNDALSAEMASSFANRLQREAGSAVDAQVERAFQLVLQRPPDEFERVDCTAFVRSRSLAELCRALMNLNEFAYVD